MREPEILLSVIIVNWNGRRYLADCLAALEPQLPPGSEIVLVDNGSTDGSLEFMHQHYPSAQIIALPNNQGFAGGVNAGIRVARGELLLLLNNDAFIEPGFIAGLLDALAQHPRAGAAGAVLTFAHQPDTVASAGIRVRRDGLALDLWAGRAAAELPQEPQLIFGASGGAVVYRRALIDDIGLLAANYFSYLEDVDFAWRAQLRGWQSLAVPAARARHVYSATGGQGSPFKQHMLGRNRIRTIIRCMPDALLWGGLAQILAYDLMASAYGLIKRQPAMLQGRLAALRDWPALRAERSEIQRRRSAPISEIARWLEPTGAPWSVLDEQRSLDKILQTRAPTAGISSPSHKDGA